MQVWYHENPAMLHVGMQPYRNEYTPFAPGENAFQDKNASSRQVLLNGILMGATGDGKPRYGYGGDFDEPDHDGNFCIDGLVTPDRIPHGGLREDHIKPQESGSHMGCTELVVNGGSKALRVTADATFSFNFSRYTQEELTARRHNWELQPSEHAVLCIDAKMSGIGSNSCGPALVPQYQANEKTWHAVFHLESACINEVKE